MTVVITEENRHQYSEALFDPKRKKDPGESWTAGRRADMEQFITQNNGARPVTLLNYNTFPLKINGGVFFPDEVPACPLGKPYTRFIISQTRWGHRDIGADAQGMIQMEPVAAIPMVQAAEYIREYAQSDAAAGGVICFIGDEDPATFKPGKKVEVPEVAYNAKGVMYIEVKQRDFHDLVAVIRRKQKSTVLRRLQQANNWHEVEAFRININDTYREDARLAFQEGWIDALPSWTLHENTEMVKQADPCPVCQVVPKAGAILCVNCEQIFDPLAAFKLGRIRYDSVEMERLTAEEWVEANKIEAARKKAKGVRPQ